MRLLKLLVSPITFLFKLPQHIRYANKIRLYALRELHQDIKELFGEGAITIITKNEDESKIVIKSIIQADADVIHVVDDQAITKSNAWPQHAEKIENTCKRLQLSATILNRTIPLIGTAIAAFQSYQIFQAENLMAILMAITIILATLFAFAIWSKYLAYYISKLPQKIFI